MSLRRPLDPSKLDAYDERIVALLAMWSPQEPHKAPPAPITITSSTQTAPTKTEALADFTKGAKQIVAAAQRAADVRGHAELDVLHVLFELLSLDGVQQALAAAKADPVAALKVAREELDAIPRGSRESCLSPSLTRLFGAVRLDVAGAEVTVRQLLHACVQPGPSASLDDLDRNVANDRKHDARARVIAAGRLDLVLAT